MLQGGLSIQSSPHAQVEDESSPTQPLEDEDVEEVLENLGENGLLCSRKSNRRANPHLARAIRIFF
jgi:hypothetical protein